MENLANSYGNQFNAPDKPANSKNFYDALNKCGSAVRIFYVNSLKLKKECYVFELF